jgi:hypothetical protein
MDDEVRILFVEDTEDDVELARRELERDGLHFTCQAQFEICSGHASGVEVLARWTPPGMEAITARPAGATEARAMLKGNWGRRLDIGLRRLRETVESRYVQ